MVTINTTAQNAGDVINDALEDLLNGLLRKQATYRTQAEKKANDALRRGAMLLAEELLAVWCPDGNTISLLE